MQQTVVVTGASSGIGLAAAADFARRGDRVVLVGRDPHRLRDAGDRIGQLTGGAPETIRADFAVLDEVRELAHRLRAGHDRIDVLVNNAGAMVQRPITTVDGFELTVQTNHLAPFLLSNLLRDGVDRVVNTASEAHRGGLIDPDDFGQSGRFRAMQAYGASKQANILFTAEAARRWPEVLSVCLHPGVVRTRFFAGSRVIGQLMRFAPFVRTPEQGADTLLWLAREHRDGLVNGGYYINRRLRSPSSRAADPALAARLWQASERAVKLG